MARTRRIQFRRRYRKHRPGRSHRGDGSVIVIRVASGFGSASTGGYGFASGSGYSSVSDSASSDVGPDGQSFASSTISASGDTFSFSGFAPAGDSFDSFSFNSSAPAEPSTFDFYSIDFQIDTGLETYTNDDLSSAIDLDGASDSIYTFDFSALDFG